MEDPNDYWTDLHTKALQGDLEGVLTEIAGGADINAKNHLGQTPLHTVLAHWAEDDALPVVQALIDQGADLDAQDTYGLTPLHFAAGLDYSNCAEVLLAAGANPQIVDSDGKKASHHCIFRLNDANSLSDTLSTAERRHELQQIAAQSRPAETEIAPPRRSSGFMM